MTRLSVVIRSAGVAGLVLLACGCAARPSHDEAVATNDDRERRFSLTIHSAEWSAEDDGSLAVLRVKVSIMNATSQVVTMYDPFAQPPFIPAVLFELLDRHGRTAPRPLVATYESATRGPRGERVQVPPEAGVFQTFQIRVPIEDVERVKYVTAVLSASVYADTATELRDFPTPESFEAKFQPAKAGPFPVPRRQRN